MQTRAVLFAVIVGCAMAASAGPVAQTRSLLVIRPDGAPPEPGVASRFTGKTHVTSRFRATDGSRISGALVHFEAGARTAWHTHPHGQTLVVTSGCGWVQQEGGAKQVLRAGDMVWTPPNVKHWHGAAANSPMSHAAIIENVDQQEVEWMDKVSAQEFGEGGCPA